jgi:hypothetical protein
MKHLPAEQLALQAGGDLGWLDGLRVRWHLRRCARCRAEAAALEQVRRDVEEAALTLPDGVNWAELEAEMRANIRLGLTAGAIVDQVSDPEWDEAAPVLAPAPEPAPVPVRRLTWSLSAPWVPAAAVLGSLTLVVLMVWLLSYPPVSFAPDRYARTPGAVMSAEGAGLSLRHAGAALMLLPPEAEHATLTMDLGAGARAEYVDVETGQMTIHQVFYGDED